MNLYMNTHIPPKNKNINNNIDKGDNKELLKACKDFEGIFLNIVLKQMRATIPESNLFGGGLDREIFESMFYEELSNKIAEGGGVGLASELYRSIILSK